MKKTFALMLSAALTLSLLPALPARAANDGGLKIVTTIFPEYEWVQHILGENPAGAQVDLLLDNGVDLHSFQPTVEDILTISTCDLFIYVGGESDFWVDNCLKEATNPDMVVLNLLHTLGDQAKEEELVEGMEGHDHDHEDEDHDHEDEDHDDEDHDHEDEDHDHDDEDHDDEDHDDEDHDHDDEDHDDEDHNHEHTETAYDEHIWLSLKNAKVLVENIADTLIQIDPDNAATYQANTQAYLEKVEALDEAYEEAVEEGARNTLLFGDRFPFRYMTEDYDLSYYAAFIGCSAETEASFETIAFLSQKVDELSLPCVLTIEGPDHRIAETIVQNTKTKDQKILTMDSIKGAFSLPLLPLMIR